MEKDVSHIFRSYDVRGIVGQDLDEEIMEKIGRSFGLLCKENIDLAYDIRTHSPALANAFESGFLGSGHDIENCGMLSMGSAMFHAWQSNQDLAFITASHLPKEWNGVKFFHKTGAGYIEKENMLVREIFLKNPASKKSGRSHSYGSKKIIDNYVRFLSSKIKMKRKLDVTIDCGNGCACILAPKLFEASGCKTKVLFGNVDGNFPNRAPDPIEKELSVLMKDVKGKDLGVAYDGDADRTALIDDKGQFMAPEDTSYVILSELLKAHKGDVVATVECTRVIDKVAAKFGRKVIRVPVGHTYLIDAVHRHKPAFGVEASGHYAMPSIIPYDDAMVIGLYVAHVLSIREEKLSELRKGIPKAFFERLSFSCPDNVKFDVIKSMSLSLKRDFDNVNTMDGIRIDQDDGWVLIRVSNTGPVIRLTVEGDTEKAKKQIQKTFLQYLENDMKTRGLKMVPETK
jgi:phosphomannomutase